MVKALTQFAMHGTYQLYEMIMVGSWWFMMEICGLMIKIILANYGCYYGDHENDGWAMVNKVQEFYQLVLVDNDVVPSLQFVVMHDGYHPTIPGFEDAFRSGVPLPFLGRSCMENPWQIHVGTTTLSLYASHWAPFYNDIDTRFPTVPENISSAATVDKLCHTLSIPGSARRDPRDRLGGALQPPWCGPSQQVAPT